MHKPQRRYAYGFRRSSLSTLLLLLLIPGSHQARSEAEQVLRESVGRLHVPAIRYRDGYARHYDEQCSAALIHERGREVSPFIVSAWHCIEHYRDLSRSLVFEAESGQRYAARLLASGGSMHSDWALLRLPTPLPAPLGLELSPGGEEPGERTLAGYPHDSGLTAEDNCRIIGRDGADVRTDCVLQQGASGGAVIDGGTTPRYLGVISRGDGETQSIYVPVERFLGRIQKYMTTSD